MSVVKKLNESILFLFIPILLFCFFEKLAHGEQNLDYPPIPRIVLKEDTWWRKEKAQKRLESNKEALVSVVNEKASQKDLLNKNKEPNLLRLSGAIFVNQNIHIAFKKLTEFNNLKLVSEYIVESTYNPIRKEIYFHFSALGFHARLLMDVKEIIHINGKKLLIFYIKVGTLKGLSGLIELKELSPNLCELSLVSTYYYKDLPVPSVFVQFGFEIVLKEIAKKLKIMIEAKN